MTFFGITILTTFTFALYIIYSCFVLNVVFTFEFLTATDIPYYNSDGGSNNPPLDQLERFGWDWWLFVTDFMRIIIPFWYDHFSLPE